MARPIIGWPKRVAATGTRAYAGKQSRMLEVLRECGALPRLLAETELDVELRIGVRPQLNPGCN